MCDDCQWEAALETAQGLDSRGFDVATNMCDWIDTNSHVTPRMQEVIDNLEERFPETGPNDW
ncbi:hypothetical protein LCGC14_0712880 [marine sediment metagenome]|uniref:Uncharacterized protein n=1 Tax=marine sediment metagenome TaxID=412755 RepID=A0A0F9TM40_9ZZZZ